MLALLLAGVLVVPLDGSTAPAGEPDALDEALALVGLAREDLGWRPKGWWPKFPADIPYKSRAFDDLFAEPLDTIPYTRLLGHEDSANRKTRNLGVGVDRSSGEVRFVPVPR